MLARFLSGVFGNASTASTTAAKETAAARAIETYVASHAVRKLHLGSGPGSLAGWLGTDVAPQAEAIVYLDAARPFPIEDGVFDYVFSEHLIEHMPWDAGLRMLRECRRVMKPGATIRVATPDLAVLLALYGGSRDAAAERYVRWITDHALPGIDSYEPAFVINNAFRSWGHQFLYDGRVLEIALRECGFVNVRRCAYGESQDDHLRGIECHGRNIGDEAIAAFETMVFESDCPVGAAR